MQPIRDAMIVAALLLASIPRLAEDVLPDFPAAHTKHGSIQACPTPKPIQSGVDPLS